jgi:hypothetical protein
MVLCDAVSPDFERDCRSLNLNDNQLTGTIPESLGSLTILV